MVENFCSFLHPLTPPLNEEDRLSWLRLIRSRKVGVATFFRMLAEHGTAQAALAALPAVAAEAGIANYEPCSIKAARAELAAGVRAGARLLCYGAPDYPRSLADLTDAPPLLWARGRAELLERPTVAVVGARNASSLGLRMARKLAADLAAEGIVVVSGLARGIDAAAHEGALPGGTVAVLAGGADVIYPQENRALTDRIVESGLILSEAPNRRRDISRCATA